MVGLSRIIKDKKLAEFITNLFAKIHSFRCLCERNLKRKPPGLFPEAMNVMMEMRSHKIAPTSISYNTLLSCLERTRRVQDPC